MRFILMLISLAILGGCATARTVAPPRAAGELQSVDERWLMAYDRRDSASIRAVFAPDARMTHASGRSSGTEDEVRSVMQENPPQLNAKWRTEDRSIRVYGSTGVVNGRYVQQGTWDGAEFTRTYNYTNVYVRLRGRWRLVHSHFSQIPAGQR